MSHTTDRQKTSWFLEHDERWSFLIPYLLLSVILGVFVSLFWLFLLILLHGWLEWFRQREVAASPRELLLRVLWELKLDISLLLLAFAIVIYTEAVFALLGAGASSRFGLQILARATAYQRVIRAILLTFDEGLIAARNAMRMWQRSDGDRDGGVHALRTIPPWRASWGIGDHIGVWVNVVSLSLLLLAPMITPYSSVEIFFLLEDELLPWPRQDAIL